MSFFNSFNSADSLSLSFLPFVRGSRFWQQAKESESGKSRKAAKVKIERRQRDRQDLFVYSKGLFVHKESAALTAGMLMMDTFARRQKASRGAVRKRVKRFPPAPATRRGEEAQSSTGWTAGERRRAAASPLSSPLKIWARGRGGGLF